jgi:hypothetical protein
MTETPIRSGIEIIDGLFNICVQILMWTADLFGVSYNTINIWIFCVIWPILTVVLISLVFKQHLKIQKLKLEINRKENE